ncbi:MAG: hypothetical protein GY936_10045 [Ignavibacteriae bacterium]|nr:hypothetical protein [Ignavibacteriota bacterium]
MKASVQQRNIDDLIGHFWRNGYLTLSRRFGKYLPEPNNVGDFRVDAIGKQRKKYVIGLVLTEKDLNDPKVFNKLEFLATRHTKLSNKRVTLFVGVPKHLIKEARSAVSFLTVEAKKSIKVVSIGKKVNKQLSLL